MSEVEVLFLCLEKILIPVETEQKTNHKTGIAEIFITLFSIQYISTASLYLNNTCNKSTQGRKRWLTPVVGVIAFVDSTNELV